MLETIRYEKRDRLAFVTLNRPDAKNAIDLAMHDELCRIWRDVRDDDQVDVAILSGVADAFCAGADLRTANYVDAAPSRVREIVNMIRWPDPRSAPDLQAGDRLGARDDDQLRTEAWNSCTCVDREEARAMLKKFYDKVDAGRAGGSPTAL